MLKLQSMKQQVLSCVDGSVSARVVLGDFDHCGVRSCVRPVDAVYLTAGPDEVRGPGAIDKGTISIAGDGTHLGR